MRLARQLDCSVSRPRLEHYISERTSDEATFSLREEEPPKLASRAREVEP